MLATVKWPVARSLWYLPGEIGHRSGSVELLEQLPGFLGRDSSDPDLSFHSARTGFSYGGLPQFHGHD